VYAIENHPKYGDSCKKILQDIEDKKFEASCSVLVLVELINVLKKVNDIISKENRKKLNLRDNIEAIISLPIVWIDLDFFIIERASTYAFEVSGVDYIHLASMETNSISEIISADQELDRAEVVKRIDPLRYGMKSR
jgi:predicted nucleic acid-binding protein